MFVLLQINFNFLVKYSLYIKKQLWYLKQLMCTSKDEELLTTAYNTYQLKHNLPQTAFQLLES